MGFYRRYGKRWFDLVVGSTAIVLAAPLLILVAALVRLKLDSPVLFTQTRAGKDGRLFRLYKFRTMSDSRRPDGTLLPDKERITSFGRLLRSTSLDELPSLWNVLRGEMSLVGPRPLLEQYLPLYSPEQARRHEVTPGITGLAQVSGRNAISWGEKFRQDVWYADNYGFLLDAAIMFRTLGTIVRREGITAKGSATMPELCSADCDRSNIGVKNVSSQRAEPNRAA